MPSRYRRSNTTISVTSVMSPASKVKVTLISPSGCSGMKVTSAVTSLPPDKKGSPVDLSIRMPFMVYSSPGIRCL